MGFIEIKNVRVAGISAGVPKNIINNLEAQTIFSKDYNNQEFVETTGVKERRIDSTLTTSDLCYRAAEKLIEELHWEKKEIRALIFVSQTFDFLAPATACILQDKLQLSKEIFAQDIELGCSGWVYGMMNLASLMQTGYIQKALLLCGDARQQYVPENPELTDPLFGYAGTATALEYEEGNEGLKCHFGTDGSGYDAIIIPGGASRYPLSTNSFIPELIDGKEILPVESRMKGMDVFSFGISTAPKSIKKLAEHFQYDYLKSDYFIFHQANKKMNDLIIKKLKLPESKVPSSMEYFGNTSSASIPLTIVTLRNILTNGEYNVTCCGFGIGLSWGTINLNMKNLIIPAIIEVNSNDNIL